jgi:5-methylcytosine-specific restriction endonuclease McrA
MSDETLAEVIADAEDFVFPQLDASAWERALYYHLLRKTHGAGQTDALVSIEALAASLGFSDWKTREVVRSMHLKGLVTIVERSRRGHLIRPNVPRQIRAIEFEALAPPELDWETADVYTNRKFAAAILRREGHSCFYCSRDLTLESVVLDHAVSLVDGGNSTYRNVVAACHDCNSLKQSTSPGDFFRMLYRRGRINADELEEGLGRLEALGSGGRPLTT